MPNYNPLGPVGLAKLWELIKGRDDNIKLWFAESSTEGSTAAKTATLANYTLVNDRIVCVKFANDNTAASPTLNINSTGDIPLYYLGSAVAADAIKANVMYVMRYNGTQYDMIGIAPPSVMDGATSQAAGAAGLVPAPAAGDDVKYLKGDATWGTPTDTQNTAGATDSSSQLYLVGAPTQGQSVQTYSQDTAYVGTDGELYSGSKKVAHQEDLDKTNGAMAIVATGNTAPKAISAGQFVLWGGNLYTANSAIASGATLSTSNLTAVPNGGLNKLNDGLSSLNSKIANLLKSKIISGTTDADGYISLGISEYQVPVYATGTNQARIQRFVCGMNSGLWGGYALCDVKSTSVTFTCWYLDFSIIL